MKVRSLDVFLDGHFWIDLPYGRSVRQTVSPGTHRIKVSNRLYTKELLADIGPGETKRLQVGNILGRLGMVLIGIGLPFYSVFIEEDESAEVR
ncbi:MAG TPA: hypothetical protein VEX38_07575 [Fimbriimonadaceae bacterium]|nr:hypothetical protein [Fimbriimonadaceae bacterium]